MEGKLAEAYVEIGSDMRPFDNSIDSVRGRIMRLAATRFNVPGGGFLSILGGAALVSGLSKSVQGASDLSETMSKVGVTFGDQSKQVTDAADEMAASFGIPKREFLDAASMFGLIGTGMGQTKDEAAAMSVRFARLATDAASFYNVPVADALEKIRAGLTGESEPLKAFGVIMDETTMKTEAARLGLVRKGQELTNQEKLIARAALIERGLASATGDLARTQDGAANQGRKFWGTLENIGDSIGAVVLPAVNRFLGLVNTIGTDIYNASQTGGTAWSGFVSGVTSGIDTLGLIYRNWGDIVELTTLNIASSFTTIIDQISHIADVTQSFLKWFATNWPTIIGDAVRASAGALGNLSEMISDPQAFAGKLLAGQLAGKGGGFGAVFGAGVDIKTPAFAPPKFAESDAAKSFAPMIDAVLDRMNKRELANADKNAKAGGAGARPGEAAGLGDGAAKAAKLGVIDFEAYNRELQDAALQREDTQKKMLDVQQKQLTQLEDIKKGLSTPRMGLGAAAVFG